VENEFQTGSQFFFSFFWLSRPIKKQENNNNNTKQGKHTYAREREPSEGHVRTREEEEKKSPWAEERKEKNIEEKHGLVLVGIISFHV
jgi:hypothetical protein